MTGHDAVRRLMAFSQGKPLPNGETLRVPKPRVSVQPSDVLVVSFLKMGGESSPWGLAWGRPGKKPEVHAVADPRRRDDVAAMLCEFAAVLLEHVLHPRHSAECPVAAHGYKTPTLPMRQVWLPNASHLEMLHYLAYTYNRTKYGSAAQQDLLRALARASGWLFRESCRTGQTMVMVGTEVLREAYTFPSDDLRQGHLGYLLAWLNTKGGRVARSAAADAAEGQSMSTSLDPEFEKVEIGTDVELFNEARRDEDQARTERWQRRIQKNLSGELVRRWDMAVEAFEVLGRDKRRENIGVARLIKATQDEHFRQYIRLEQKADDEDDGPAFFPSPETDRHPAAAGSRYYVYASSDELRNRLLVHDDRQMQREQVSSGDAIEGKLTDLVVEKVGRATRVFWTVETDGRRPLRLREGASLCPVGHESWKLQILEIVQPDAETYRFELEVTAGVRSANDPQLKKRPVVLVQPPMDGIQRRKSRAIWKADGPGAWLTHAAPKGPGSDLPEDVADDMDTMRRR